MTANKMFFVLIGAFVSVWAASMVFTYFSSGNGMPLVFNIKSDGKFTMVAAPTPTSFPAYPTPTPDLQSQPVHTDKGIIEYLLGCDMKCP
jgi:hypothetical protein